MLAHDDPGGKRPQDQGGSGAGGDGPEDQQKGKGGHEQDPPQANPRYASEEPRRHGAADHDGRHQEPDRHREGAHDTEQTHRRAGRHPGDDTEEDEAQHVVNDGCPQHDPRLDGVQALQVGQDPSGDADRRRGQRSAHEHCRHDVVRNCVLEAARRRHPVQEPQPERHDHACDGHGRRGRADARHRIETGLEADFEQEDSHPDVGEDPEGAGQRIFRGRWEDVERAQEHSRHQLAHHAGLPQPLTQRRRERPCHEHDCQDDEETSDVIPVSRRAGKRRDQQHAASDGPRARAAAWP